MMTVMYLIMCFCHISYWMIKKKIDGSGVHSYYNHCSYSSWSVHHCKVVLGEQSQPDLTHSHAQNMTALEIIDIAGACGIRGGNGELARNLRVPQAQRQEHNEKEAACQGDHHYHSPTPSHVYLLGCVRISTYVPSSACTTMYSVVVNVTKHACMHDNS